MHAYIINISCSKFVMLNLNLFLYSEVFAIECGFYSLRINNGMGFISYI